MPRLLPIALVASIVVAIVAGIAYARLSGQAFGVDEPRLAPMATPAEQPSLDPTHAGAYGFRSGDEIADDLNPGAQDAIEPSQPMSDTMEVNATVLPTVVIVVDPETRGLVRISINTSERDPDGVLFLPRIGSEDGAPVELDEELWTSVRAALAEAESGTGTIWAA